MLAVVLGHCYAGLPKITVNMLTALRTTKKVGTKRSLPNLSTNMYFWKGRSIVSAIFSLVWTAQDLKFKMCKHCVDTMR